MGEDGDEEEEEEDGNEDGESTSLNTDTTLDTGLFTTDAFRENLKTLDFPDNFSEIKDGSARINAHLGISTASENFKSDIKNFIIQ